MFWPLASAFYLNDFLFIYWIGQTTLYFIDYAVRIAILAVCLGLPSYRAVSLVPLSEARLGWLWVLALIPACILADRAAHIWIEPLVIDWVGRTGLFYFGAIESAPLRLFDLTVGLMLVALSEELVFRKFALKWLKDAGVGSTACVLISASVFALMHWGSGLNRIAATFVFGALAMAFYMRHTRLWPLVIAHYVTNFIAFSDFD